MSSPTPEDQRTVIARMLWFAWYHDGSDDPSPEDEEAEWAYFRNVVPDLNGASGRNFLRTRSAIFRQADRMLASLPQAMDTEQNRRKAEAALDMLWLAQPEGADWSKLFATIHAGLSASLPQARAVGDEEVEEIARALFQWHRVYQGYNDETRERLYQSQRASLIDQVRLVASALATLPPAPGWRGMDSAPRDGTRIVLAEYDDGGQWPDDAKWTFWTDHWRKYMEPYGEGFGQPRTPSCWQPLPSPPSPSEEVG